MTLPATGRPDEAVREVAQGAAEEQAQGQGPSPGAEVLRHVHDGHQHHHGDDRHDPRVAGAERERRTRIADELEPDDVPDERPRLSVREDVESDELADLVARVGEDRDDDEKGEEPPPARGGRVVWAGLRTPRILGLR